MKFDIDIKEKVLLNGLKQKIHIIGTKKENPVLLVLHGGPGISNRHTVMTRESDLTDDFTVVAWDQRGTGGSYWGCKVETLSKDSLVEDARALVSYLCDKLNKKKVFILGGSWGTTLGTFLCYNYPEQIAGYIGFGQVVDGGMNEDISYAYTIECATKADDQESLEILRKVGPPIKGQYKPCFDGMMAQRKILAKYGGHNVKKMSYWESTVKPMLLSKEYSFSDKLGLIKGYKYCLANMWPTICDYNLRVEYNQFKVPYYIFQGRLDKNTPSDLIEEYYAILQAPDKDLVWFENSAHGVIGEEPAKFKATLREKFLKIASEENLNK